MGKHSQYRPRNYSHKIANALKRALFSESTKVIEIRGGLDILMVEGPVVGVYSRASRFYYLPQALFRAQARTSRRYVYLKHNKTTGDLSPGTFQTPIDDRVEYVIMDMDWYDSVVAGLHPTNSEPAAALPTARLGPPKGFDAGRAPTVRDARSSREEQVLECVRQLYRLLVGANDNSAPCSKHQGGEA